MRHCRKKKGVIDNKGASASAFLCQVKRKLNGEEYNRFLGYVQGLKKKELKLVNVMESIVQLLCGSGSGSGTETEHLLMGIQGLCANKTSSCI